MEEDNIRKPDTSFTEKIINDNTEEDPHIIKIMNDNTIDKELKKILIESRREFIVKSLNINNVIKDNINQKKVIKNINHNNIKDNIIILCEYLEKINIEDKNFDKYYEEISINISEYLSKNTIKIELNLINYNKLLEIINESSFDSNIKNLLFNNITIKNNFDEEQDLNKIIEESKIEYENKIKEIELQNNLEIEKRNKNLDIFRKQLISLSRFDTNIMNIKNNIIDKINNFLELEIDLIYIESKEVYNEIIKFISKIRITDDIKIYLNEIIKN